MKKKLFMVIVSLMLVLNVFSGMAFAAVTMPSAAIVGFTAPAVYSDAITLDWNSISGATDYEVQRNGQTVYNGPDTTFTDSGLTNGTSYTYNLYAVDSSGPSSGSVSVTATTSGLPHGDMYPDPSKLTSSTVATIPSGASNFQLFDNKYLTFMNSTDGYFEMMDIGTGNITKIWQYAAHQNFFMTQDMNYIYYTDSNYNVHEVNLSTQADTVIYTKVVAGANSFTRTNIVQDYGTDNVIINQWDASNFAYDYSHVLMYNPSTGNTTTLYSGNTMIADSYYNGDLALQGYSDHTMEVYNVSTQATTPIATASGTYTNFDFASLNGRFLVFTDSGSSTYDDIVYDLQSKSVYYTMPKDVQVKTSNSYRSQSVELYNTSGGAVPGILDLMDGYLTQGTSAIGSNTILAINRTGSILLAQNGSSLQAFQAGASSPPGAPSGLTTTNTSTSATLSWTAPAGATSYRVTRNGVQVYSGTSTSFTDSGLSVGNTYNYNVYASNSYGEGSPASAAVTIADTNSTLTAFSMSGVDISPSFASGTLSYSGTYPNTDTSSTATFTTGSPNATVTVNGTASTGTSSITLGGTSTTVSVVVTAPAGNTSTYTFNLTSQVPAPSSFSDSNLSYTSMDLSWGSLSGVTGYKLYRDGTLIYTGANTSYSDTGLTAGTTYNYTVEGYSGSGNGATSTLSATTLAAPSAPTGLASSNVQPTSADLSWTAVSGVTGYKVYQNGTLVYTGTNTTYSATGLTSGTTYSYSVEGYVGTTNGAPATTSVTTPVPASAPTGVSSSSVTTTSATVSWNPISGVDGYKVYRNGTLVYTGTATSFSDTGLSPMTSYTYTVEGYVGNVSGNTTTQTVTTTGSAPSSLASSSVTTTSASLSWGPVSGATGYNIYQNGTLVGTTTTTSYSASGLTKGTTYTYTVKAVNGSVEGSPATTSITTLSNPSAPTGLTSSNVTTTSATLNWNAISGVDGYKVFKDGTNIATVTSATYTDPNLTPGTSYNYAVEGYIGTLDGTQATLTVSTPLSSPTGVTSSNVSGSSVTLSWNANPNATSYTITRNGSVVYTGTSTTFIDTGLSPNSTYTYNVSAVNSSGSGQSSQIVVTTGSNIPNTPANFAASNVTDSSITLSWDSVPSSLGYKLYRDGTLIYQGTNTVYVDSGLNSGQSHTYTVEAYNSTNSSAKATVTQATSYTVPSAPTGLEPLSVGSNGLTLFWNKMPDATSYNVYRGGTLVYSGASNTFIDSGLLPSTTYYYSVKSVNIDVSGPASNVSVKTGPVQTPGVPTGLLATGTTSSATIISWNAVSGTSYILSRNGTQIYSGSASGYNDTGLTDNTTYEYSLVAVRDGLTSGPASLSVTTQSNYVAPVSNLRATYVSESKIDLAWSGTGNSYNVSQDGTTVTSVTYSVYSASNLLPNTTYTFSVEAVNGKSVSGPVSVSVKTLSNTAPTSAPTLSSSFQLSAVDVTSNSAVLGWNTVTQATYYNLYRNGSPIYEGPDLTYKDTNLTQSTSYIYSVTASNKLGTSAASSLPVTTLTPLPDKPTNLVASMIDSDYVILQWDAAKNATSYTVLRNDSTIVYSGPDTTFKDSTVTPSTTYSYKVVAQDSAGTATSDPISVTTIATPPVVSVSQPSTTTTTVSFSFKVINGADTYYIQRNPQWTIKSNGNGTYHETYFNTKTMESRDLGMISPVNGKFNFSESGLTPGASYHYNVTAIKTNTSTGSQIVVGQSGVTTTMPTSTSSSSGGSSSGGSGGGSSSVSTGGSSGGSASGSTTGNTSGNTTVATSGSSTGTNSGSDVASTVGTTTTPPFSDIGNSWGKDPIQYLAGKGIVKGYPDGTFRPNADVTRAEFTAMLERALTYKDVKNGSKVESFSDVSSSDWFYSDVKDAYSNGFVKGYSVSTFAPNKNISREEMVAIVTRAYLYLHPDTFIPQLNDLASFTDRSKVDLWAVPVVQKSVYLGLLKGDNDQLLPQSNATRVEAAEFIYRLLTDK